MLGFVAAFELFALCFSTCAQDAGKQPRRQCVFGPDGAAIRIELFSDFQCPACRALYLQTILPLLQDRRFENSLCLIYRDLPLNRHSYAREASRYAIAARRLGPDQWLRLAEALYTYQEQWAGNGNVGQIAAQTLLPRDMSRLRLHLADPTLEKNLNDDCALARQRKIQSTPTFFIYAGGTEQRVSGTVPYPVLRDQLSRLLK